MASCACEDCALVSRERWDSSPPDWPTVRKITKLTLGGGSSSAYFYFFLYLNVTYILLLLSAYVLMERRHSSAHKMEAFTVFCQDDLVTFSASLSDASQSTDIFNVLQKITTKSEITNS